MKKLQYYIIKQQIKKLNKKDLKKLKKQLTNKNKANIIKVTIKIRQNKTYRVVRKYKNIRPTEGLELNKKPGFNDKPEENNYHSHRG